MFTSFFSGKVVTELAKFKLIPAVVLLHPSFVSVEDIKGMNSAVEAYFLTTEVFIS